MLGHLPQNFVFVPDSHIVGEANPHAGMHLRENYCDEQKLQRTITIAASAFSIHTGFIRWSRSRRVLPNERLVADAAVDRIGFLLGDIPSLGCSREHLEDKNNNLTGLPIPGDFLVLPKRGSIAGN